VWSIGLAPGGSPRDLILWATTGAIRRSGAPIKSLDQQMFWRDPQWVGRESIGAALG
jgi:hypothetical protein